MHSSSKTNPNLVDKCSLSRRSVGRMTPRLVPIKNRPEGPENVGIVGALFYQDLSSCLWSCAPWSCAVDDVQLSLFVILIFVHPFPRSFLLLNFSLLYFSPKVLDIANRVNLRREVRLHASPRQTDQIPSCLYTFC